mgnify:CR=1 FL=1
MEQLSTSTYRKWSTSEESLLRKEAKKTDVLNLAFIKVATQTGRSISAVNQHYNIMHNRENEEKKSHKKWTEEEELRLIRQVRAFPQNLNKCFLLVSEELERTPAAVSAHWYSVTSKRSDVLCFFTASETHISKNRKNADGVPSTTSIWKKFLKILKRI